MLRKTPSALFLTFPLLIFFRIIFPGMFWCSSGHVQRHKQHLENVSPQSIPECGITDSASQGASAKEAEKLKLILTTSQANLALEQQNYDKYNALLQQKNMD